MARVIQTGLMLTNSKDAMNIHEVMSSTSGMPASHVDGVPRKGYSPQTVKPPLQLVFQCSDGGM